MIAFRHMPIASTTGGGVSFSNWIQILSDTFGSRLVVSDVASPEAVGAVILAGIGIGDIADARKFTSKMFQGERCTKQGSARCVQRNLREIQDVKRTGPAL